MKIILQFMISTSYLFYISKIMYNDLVTKSKTILLVQKSELQTDKFLHAYKISMQCSMPEFLM